jgi:hypothetical protein
MTLPGTYREVDKMPVSGSDALVAWVKHARPALERTAKTYHATITYKDLSEEVQAESGIRTRRLLQHWIGDVLGTVSRNSHAAGEPLLSALCVRADGTVGPGYGIAIVENFGGEPPADLDMHAAEERFKCYQHFGATMPEGGGRPALTKQVAAARQRARRRTSPAETSRPMCPTCHLMLPISGQCDTCS